MLSEMEPSVTSLLDRLRQGDRAAFDPLIAIVYPELHRIAASYLRANRSPGVLQPTELVHEAYLRLVGAERADFHDRTHFFWTVCSRNRPGLVRPAPFRYAAQRRWH